MGARDAAVVSRDDLVVGAARRLAAVAGVDATVAASSAEVRRCWRGARLVLVGADMAASVAEAGLPRREGVVVVGHDPLGLDVWRAAVGLGAAHVAVLPD